MDNDKSPGPDGLNKEFYILIAQVWSIPIILSQTKLILLQINLLKMFTSILIKLIGVYLIFFPNRN
jgi:hypothetical protein